MQCELTNITKHAGFYRATYRHGKEYRKLIISENDALDLYFLSWVNDFVTIDGFADYYGLTRDNAINIINNGRAVHEQRAA